MTIEIKKNAAETIIRIVGRLDTITAPALDKAINEDIGFLPGNDALCTQHGSLGHGAGDIQHEHGVGGLGAAADNDGIGAHGRQGNQEVAVRRLQVIGEFTGCGGLGKYGLVRPDAAGMSGGNILGIKEALPIIHSAGIRNGGVRRGACREAQGRQEGYDHHNAQQHCDQPLGETVPSCHFSTTPFSKE